MIVKDLKHYDGTLLHHRFAYTYFRDKVLPIGNIIAFRGSTKVETEGLIDQEDALNKEFIYSEDMVHFLYELPLVQEGFGAIAYQRLFNTLVAGILYKHIQVPIEVDGDDLMVTKEFTQGGVTQHKGKCSVSIVHVKNGAALGHTGINIVAGKQAPAFAFSTNLNDQQAETFMGEVIEMFYKTNDDIFVASSKIISH